jgi:RNA polymerase sigma factor (sigma-70 family)
LDIAVLRDKLLGSRFPTDWRPAVSEPSRFLDLLARLRAGDDRAAADLFAEYEPAVRRMVRTRLRNLSLQRLVGEEDVCQSVMKSFFVRYRLGQYDLAGPEQLRGLLARMAGNKLNDQHRRNLAGRRGGGRAGEQLPDNVLPAGGETPSLKLGNQELLEEAIRRMTPEERELRKLFLGQALGWPEIAARLGGTAEGRRKQWERARERVTEELGLEA